MITQSIDVVLSNPGIWMAVTNVLRLVEVEPGGVCHQLNMRTMERDGVLPPGGWFIENGIRFVGPMARAAQTVRESAYDWDRP